MGSHTAQVVVLGDARGGLSVASLTNPQHFKGHTSGAAHAGHVMDIFFKRDASTGVPVVYSGDNADSCRNRTRLK